MKFWISHPATEEPVSFVRWLKWHASQWLRSIASAWESDALHPGWREDEDQIPF